MLQKVASFVIERRCNKKFWWLLGLGMWISGTAIIYIIVWHQSSKMDKFVPIVPYGYTFSPPTPLYLTQGQLLMQNPFFTQNMQGTSTSNLETPFVELYQKYSQVLAENESLKNKLEDALSLVQNLQETRPPKRKIRRRREDQLDKKYHCCYDECKKEYASLLALNLHIKTRHRGGTKKQRDNLAKQIILAEMKGEPAPKQKIFLPSGYVDNYRKQHFVGDIFHD